MDKRTFFIILVLILPIALVILLSHSVNSPSSQDPITSAEAPSTSTPNRLNQSPPATLEEARSRARQRLSDLEKMTPQEWETEKKARRHWAERQRGLPSLEPRVPEVQGAPATIPDSGGTPREY